MENGANRVLAYLLAKTIDDNHLDQIAGGSAHMSSRHTVQVSGGSAQGPDFYYDVAADM